MSQFAEATIAFAKTATDETPLGLDLNRLLVQRPAATFYMTLEGQELERLGWSAGDLVAIDRSLTPNHQQLVVAEVDDEFRLCRWRDADGGQLVTVTDGRQVSAEREIWGVVTHVIHKC